MTCHLKNGVTICDIGVRAFNSQLLCHSQWKCCRGPAHGRGNKPQDAMASLQWRACLESELRAGLGSFCQQDSSLWQRDSLLGRCDSSLKGAGSPDRYLMHTDCWEIYDTRGFNPGRVTLDIFKPTISRTYFISWFSFPLDIATVSVSPQGTFSWKTDMLFHVTPH